MTETDPLDTHGMTMDGEPAMPILVAEYNALVSRVNEAEARAAAPSAPADRGALYRELADEAAEWGGVITEQELRRKARQATAAVLPAPAGRAAILREAAEVSARFNSDCQNCAVELEVATKLRRMADEAQQPEAQAGCSQCGHRACMGRGRCGVVMTSGAGIVRPPCQCLGATRDVEARQADTAGEQQ